MKNIIPSTDQVQQVLKQIISLSDHETLSLALKEIDRGKVLFPWRKFKSSRKCGYWQSISCRDSFLHKEHIKIAHNTRTVSGSFGNTSIIEYYDCFIGCHSRTMHSDFRNFFEKNESQILTLPGLIYKAGDKLDVNTKLRFNSLQFAQDYCDQVLNFSNYILL